MEFNLLTLGSYYGTIWLEVGCYKGKRYEPALLRVARGTGGKWDFDFLGIGELLHWWRLRR